jgi:hypothetical protein
MTMTAIHGIITSITNGVLLLDSGVKVRVPASVLRVVTLGQPITLWMYAIGDKKRNNVNLFGFLTEADRDLFVRWLKQNADDPVGALTMIDSGLPLPEPPDPDVGKIAHLLRDFTDSLDMPKGQIEAFIRQTNRGASLIDRAEEALRIIVAAMREEREEREQ